MSFTRAILMAACVAALAACNQQGAAPAADGAPATQTATAAAPASCDAPAVPLALGASVSGDIPVAESYPENARYYCFNIPAGAQNVTVELSGMSVDLDLYVGSGSINSVQGVNLEQGETYQWKSNAFGTDNETVTISAPEAGTYYAEIVSFQGQASPYTFSVR